MPDEPTANRAWYGRFGADLVDQVVLVVRRSTPTVWLEIHCHGGPEIIRVLERLFTDAGVTAVDWPCLELLTGADEQHVALLQLLAEAPTMRTVGILLDQLNGAFDRALAELDGLEGEERRRRLHRLEKLIHVGRHLVAPWRVVVLGPPNAGKSSLVNALAGFARSVVSETPGTTRDVVTTRLALGGWPIELADTAGLRGDASPLERAGMALALGEAASADLCLWVVERTALPPPEIPPSRCVLVRNKIDLPAPPDEMNVGDIVRVSARTGEGLDVLIARIVSELIPNVPAPGEAVPVLEAHRIRLAQAVAEVSSPTARG